MFSLSDSESAQMIMSKLSSMTSLFYFNNIGTVLVLDLFINSNGVFFKSTSLISTLISQINNAHLARIAYGHLRNEYKISVVIL